MHFMIVEHRRNAYESKIFEEGMKSIEKGIFIDEDGIGKNFE